MPINMYCPGHMGGNEKFRDGWDRIWGKKNNNPELSRKQPRKLPRKNQLWVDSLIGKASVLQAER